MSYNQQLQANNTNLQSVLNRINVMGSKIKEEHDLLFNLVFGNRDLSIATNSECTYITPSAFAYCTSLTTANFPACIDVAESAFTYCSSLTTINFASCESIGLHAFAYCTSLTTANFPACKTVGGSAFFDCSALTTASFPACTNIDNYAFYYCQSLSKIYLGASTVCVLVQSKAFSHTAITPTTGSIYVPASLVASYKNATNWAYFSNRIFSIT